MLQRFLITFCIVVSLVIVFSAIVTQKREKRRSLESQLKTLSEEVASAKEKNSLLTQETEAIANDPIQVERVARENFGYAKPGEIIYKNINLKFLSPKKRLSVRQAL